MLCELIIENIAVIERASVTFERGFNVLTGETGAGKSIVIDSVGALLGHRLPKDVLRTGTQKGSICAVFEKVPKQVCDVLTELGFEPQEQLIITRELTADGRGTVRINGRPALVSMLREFMPNLLTIHGQQENYNLLTPDTQLKLLDRYGGTQELKKQYNSVYRELCERIKQLDNLTKNEEENTKRADLLRFQIDEIEKAAFKKGEPEELKRRHNLLTNLEKIINGYVGAKETLGEEQYGTLSSLTTVVNSLSGVPETQIEGFKQRAENLFFELQELHVDISGALERCEAQPGELDTVEMRLDELYKLRQKYGDDLEDIERYYNEASKELSMIDNSEQAISELEQDIDRLGQQAKQLAATLTKERKKTFSKLQKEIVNSLGELNMPGMHFELHCEHRSLARDGADNIEFLIATNPGDLPKSLTKIASGGELARIMLAIKNSLADVDDMPTVIYDEIDTGVSGSSSYKIGRMMRRTAQNRQVLAVTHSAQLACFADNHLLIEKSTEKNSASTHITPLDMEGRTLELARIMSGDSITQTAKANAEELINTAMKE